MKELINTMVAKVVARHLLSMLGGLLIGYGIIDEATWTQVSGGLLTIFAAVGEIL